MSLKQTLFYPALLLIMLSCNKRGDVEYTTLNDVEKEELANFYHQKSNYFLQPSELYRTYKDSALMVQPDNVDIRQRLSYSYKKVGDHIKAMDILNKSVDIDVAKGKVDALEYRAWTLLYFYRDYEAVIHDVDLIEKLTGKVYNVCWGEPCGFQKGQALYKIGRYEDAIQAFELVNIEEEKMGFDINDNHFNFFYMGRCYEELKDYDNAIDHYRMSLRSVEQFPEAYYHLGLVYKKIGDFKKAETQFELAKSYVHYGMREPYIERFDKVFLYMIERELN